MCLLYDCCMFASMGEKAMWDNANLKHFIDICKEEIGVGNICLMVVLLEMVGRNLRKSFL
jgi:hypothetical protein